MLKGYKKHRDIYISQRDIKLMKFVTCLSIYVIYLWQMLHSVTDLGSLLLFTYTLHVDVARLHHQTVNMYRLSIHTSISITAGYRINIFATISSYINPHLKCFTIISSSVILAHEPCNESLHQLYALRRTSPSLTTSPSIVDSPLRIPNSDASICRIFFHVLNNIGSIVNPGRSKFAGNTWPR